MLGGGWGTQLTVPGCRDKWKEIWPKILSDHSAKASRTGKGVDQSILAAYVWSQLGGADEAFQHDSYTCRHFPGSVGWPTQREHGIKNYFGAIGMPSGVPKKKATLIGLFVSFLGPFLVRAISRHSA